MAIFFTPDATGTVGLTFEAGRLPQFVDSARHNGGGAWSNQGLALRLLPGAESPMAVAGFQHELLSSPTRNDDGAPLDTPHPSLVGHHFPFDTGRTD